MVEHEHGHGNHADVQHEQSDVNVRGIFGFGAGLALLGVVAAMVVWLLFGYLARREDSASAGRLYPLAIGHEDRLPAEPRLQANPRQDLKDLLAAEDAILNGYRWVDRNAGIVRLPIDEAMRLTIERGLPSRGSPAPEAGRQP